MKKSDELEIGSLVVIVTATRKGEKGIVITKNWCNIDCYVLFCDGTQLWYSPHELIIK